MNETDFNTLVICAFRYAVERSTYVTAEISDLIRRHLSELTEQTIDILKREINRVIERKEFISTIDIPIWKNLLKDIEDYERKD